MTSFRLLRFPAFVWFASVTVLLCCIRPAAASPQAPMQMQAQQAAQGPMKLTVKPLAQGARIGSQVTLEVTLLDANNQPVRARYPHRIALELFSPSGKSVKALVTIPPGQSSAHYSFAAQESGLTSVRAHDSDQHLLGSSNSILIRPAPAVKKTIPAKPKHMGFYRGDAPVRWQTVGLRTLEPLAPRLAAQAPAPSVAVENLGSPGLMLSLTGGEDEFLADGKDAARI